MSDNSTTRVHYFEGQFLRTQDFTDEQSYHVAMRRRHNISHHIWGIVSGLQIVIEEGSFYVQPGFAIDGYGRELILPQKTALSSSAFTAKGSNELDVWLAYGLTSTDKPPAGFAGCGNGDSSSASFYRSQETAQIILERPDPDFSNRRVPEAVAIPDRSFNASQTPPDSPQSSWPVFLGQILQDLSNQQEPFVVKLDDRPYVGLVGEAIYAPSGRTRVQVGSELADDPRRFAVFTLDDSTPPKLAPRFEVDNKGEASVTGNANIEGNLVMAGGAIEFEAGTARAAAAPPWNVYHLSENGEEELRIEMARPATPAGNNQVVIGAWFKGPDETGQEKEEFHPCLTIRDNCTVEISGDLIIKGELKAGSIVGGQLSEAARNAASAALTSGILATSGRLTEIPQSPPSALGFTSAIVSAEAVSAEAVADRVATDPSFREAFARRMKATHSEEIGLLNQALIITPP